MTDQKPDYNQAAESLYGKPDQATTDPERTNQHLVPETNLKPVKAKI